MATLGHIALLCRSFEEWNRARADEGFAPDLSHVEIRKARLGRLDLRGAELDGARLIDVDLRGARLQQARLNGVRAIRTSFQFFGKVVFKDLEEGRAVGALCEVIAHEESDTGDVRDKRPLVVAIRPDGHRATRD